MGKGSSIYTNVIKHGYPNNFPQTIIFMCRSWGKFIKRKYFGATFKELLNEYDHLTVRHMCRLSFYSKIIPIFSSIKYHVYLN